MMEDIIFSLFGSELPLRVFHANRIRCNVSISLSPLKIHLLKLKNIFFNKNWPTPASFVLFLFFSNTLFAGENCRFQ